MAVTHRYNTSERQHYLLEQHYSFRLKPQLLYVGQLDRQPGWTEELHTHDFVELIFVLDGKGTATIDDQTFPIKKGDLVVYNAGLTHSETSSTDAPLELQFLAWDKLQITDLPPNWLIPPSYGYIFASEEMYPVFCQYFRTLLQEFETKSHLYIDVAQNVSRTLLMYLFRLINQTGSNASLLGKNRTIAHLLSYIEQHFREQLSLEQISQACFCNVYYLSHIFTQEQGMSIGKYILSRRMEEAKRLLRETSLPINEVGVAVGLPDASYFCRIFKKTCGMTPLKYRRSIEKS
ncbi:MAG: AraC family transcriptional regulator [Oscillospiraceae bacterium]|nr:AraC family transcriptional regulator [Oscillospiraceae bacterium]